MDETYTREDIAANIEKARENIRTAAASAGRKAEDVTLLLATKTVDAGTINFAISRGVRHIGENRVQELLEKYDKLNKDGVSVHFIGRLQTNKVKYIIDKVCMIHSVDSLKLAQEIDRQAEKHGLVMDVLVEVNIGEEASKGGILPSETESFLRELSGLKHIRVKGLMTIPPVCETTEQRNISSNCSNKIYKNKAYFEKIAKLFLDISEKKIDNIDMYELSAGMSDDYESAILCGATVVRLGRAVFGSRTTVQKQ